MNNPIGQFESIPPALPALRSELLGRAGRINYYVSDCGGDSTGSAPPLLLIHSVNAAGSAYEVRPLYEHFGKHRIVYAMDLPGFGFSDRSARDYTPRLMTDAILDMTDEIRNRHGAVAIDALAVSLASEFLARAATEAPDRFRSVALVSPTGFDRRAPYKKSKGSNRGIPWLYAAFANKPWSRPFFNFLTTKGSIRFFLRKTFGSKAIDEGLAHYDYLTARHRNAHHVVFRFVSGYLFSADITDVYESLSVPVWMSHGTRGDFVDYRYKSAFESRPHWHFETFDTGALPYFEQSRAFNDIYEQFLAKQPRST